MLLFNTIKSEEKSIRRSKRKSAGEASVKVRLDDIMEICYTILSSFACFSFFKNLGRRKRVGVGNIPGL